MKIINNLFSLFRKEQFKFVHINFKKLFINNLDKENILEVFNLLQNNLTHTKLFAQNLAQYINLEGKNLLNY